MPANSIGFFSAVTSGKRRDRTIYCLRQEDPLRPFVTTPANVGWSRTIYGAGKGKLFDHDTFFAPYEQLNSDAIETLFSERSGQKDADLWVKLAGYVASRLTRNPDLEFEAAEIIASWTGGAAVGYPLNMQRTAAAVLRCRWEFAVSDDYEFILSDRGFVGFVHPEWKARALFVPLRRHIAVVIGGDQRFQKQLTWRGDRWDIDIPTQVLIRSAAEQLNALSWVCSRRECYASSSELLTDASGVSQLEVPPDYADRVRAHEQFMDVLGSTVEECRRDETLLHRLLVGILPPSRDPQHSNHHLIV